MRVADVPAADANYDELCRFASTSYFGYDRHGGIRKLGGLAKECRAKWEATGELPEGLEHLRAALFFEARTGHHLGVDGGALTGEPYMRALLEAIRAASGGQVRQDSNTAIMWARRLTNMARRDWRARVSRRGPGRS